MRGAQATYNITLKQFLTEMFSAAEESGTSGMMPWQLIPWDVKFVSYDFSINDPAFPAVADMIAYQAARVRHPRRAPRSQAGVMPLVPEVAAVSMPPCPVQLSAARSVC